MKKIINLVLLLGNLQCLIVFLIIAFGNYDGLVNNTDKLWNKYLVASLFIFPILSILYHTILLVKEKK